MGKDKLIMKDTTSQYIMQRVLAPDNINLAMKEVIKKDGQAGIDGVSVDQLRGYWSENERRILAQLRSGSYKPSHYKTVFIRKSKGGYRRLEIPTTMDRMLQRAVLQVIEPIFDPGFSPFSYGYRPQRNAQQAVLKAQSYIHQGYNYVVSIDLEDCFGSIDHKLLLQKVGGKLEDMAVTSLTQRYVKNSSVSKGRLQKRTRGVCQGGPLSPLLANILLDDLDKELEDRGHRFVRYADDFNIFVRSKAAGERVMRRTSAFLEKQLRLNLNISKSFIGRPWAVGLLGFTFTQERRPKITIPEHTIIAFKDKVKSITDRRLKIHPERKLKQLEDYLVGWIGYYSLSTNPSIFQELGAWLAEECQPLPENACSIPRKGALSPLYA